MKEGKQQKEVHNNEGVQEKEKQQKEILKNEGVQEKEKQQKEILKNEGLQDKSKEKEVIIESINHNVQDDHTEGQEVDSESFEEETQKKYVKANLAVTSKPTSETFTGWLNIPFPLHLKSIVTA